MGNKNNTRKAKPKTQRRKLILEKCASMRRNKAVTQALIKSASEIHSSTRLKKESDLQQGSQWQSNCDTINQKTIPNDLDRKLIVNIDNGDDIGKKDVETGSVNGDDIGKKDDETGSVNGDDIGKKDDETGSVTRCQTPVNEETISNNLDPIKTEIHIDNIDDSEVKYNECGSETRCQTPVNEEEWVVRRQLCRGCHSDGAFWSLQTTTEGVAYGDLLQTYFNIQLCPVSADELALSAICSLCAARLREARAFSVQAHAAEERFTQWYTQNRIRVLAKEEGIQEGDTIIQKGDDYFEITIEPERETDNGNLALCKEVEGKEDVSKENNEDDDIDTTDVGEPETVNTNIDDCGKAETGKPDTVKPKIVKVTKSDYEHIKGGFTCARCGKLFNTLHGISQHVKRHQKPVKRNQKHSTNKSEDPFKLSPSDYKHIKDIFKCNRCDQQYNIYTEILQHIKKTHLPRYTCPQCEETFSHLGPFTKHKFIEHSIDHRIKCKACNWATYKTKVCLTRHMNVFHMLGDKLTCPDCDFVSYCRETMAKHAVKHFTVKDHHCKYCKKSFLRKSNLIIHEKIHTGDKRKVCDVCGQAFVQRASLTYHMTKHHPEVRL